MWLLSLGVGGGGACDCRGQMHRRRRAVDPTPEPWGASSLVEWKKDTELSEDGREWCQKQDTALETSM